MTDEASIPVIPKWPFYLGDLFCILGAVMIGLKTDGPLGYFLVFALMVVGAIVVMVPFVKEFNARARYRRIDLREEIEAQRAMVLAIATDSQAASRGVLQLAEQIRQMMAPIQDLGHSDKADFEKIEAAVEELSRQIAQKKELCVEEIARQTADACTPPIAALQSAIAPLSVLKADLASELKILTGKIDRLAQTVETLSRSQQVSSPRSKNGKSELLKKALSQVQDAAQAPAVSRLIGLNKDAESAPSDDAMDNIDSPVETEPAAQNDSDAVPSDTPDSPAELIIEPLEDALPEETEAGETAAESDEAASPAAEVAAPVEEAEPASQASVQDEHQSRHSSAGGILPGDLPPTNLFEASSLSENFDKVIKQREAAKAAKAAEEGSRPFEAAAQGEKSTDPAPQKLPEDEASVPSDPLGALAESTPVRPKVPRKLRGKHATLDAKLLIGIGNKPYVRGVGPGLSPDKGVPMQFVEIGLWRWIAPEGASYTDVRVYKNDEVPATGEALSIAADEHLEVEPLFEK